MANEKLDIKLMLFLVIYYFLRISIVCSEVHLLLILKLSQSRRSFAHVKRGEEKAISQIGFRARTAPQLPSDRRLFAPIRIIAGLIRKCQIGSD